MRDQYIPQFFLCICTKSCQDLFHLLCIRLCLKKVIQGAERIIQTNLLFAVSKFCLLLLDHINNTVF